MVGFLLKILKNPWISATAVSWVVVLALFLLLQSSRIDVAQTELQAAVVAQQNAESRYNALQALYDDLQKRKDELDKQNRKTDIELAIARRAIKDWEAKNDQAIKDPIADGADVNTYAQRLFLGFSCSTGSGVCTNPNGAPR